MSIRFENECVGCPPRMGCLRSACPYMNVPRYYCDECGADCDLDELHEVDGEDVCDDCMEEYLKKQGIVKDSKTKGMCVYCEQEFDAEDLHDVDGELVCKNCFLEYLEESGTIGPVDVSDYYD